MLFARRDTKSDRKEGITREYMFLENLHIVINNIVERMRVYKCWLKRAR